MAMDGPSGMGTDGNVTCHLFTCVMVKSTNGDVMGTKSDTRPMHNRLSCRSGGEAPLAFARNRLLRAGFVSV